MKKIFPFGFVFLLSFFCIAQPNREVIQKYIRTDNPYYWKNKKPYEGYWQQDVHYKMKLYVDEKTDVLSGEEELVYVNNSPDTLCFVYFHLYQNAFQPGSYYDQLQQSNRNEVQYGKYQKQKLGTIVESIKIKDRELKTQSDNTILKVWLNEPLLPGNYTTFHIRFKTYFDITAQWGRMRVYNSYGFKHYNGAHFYPRIAVYDLRSGWDTDQHLGHEFYGDYGTYEVELNMANNFIVEATGILKNQDEVLPKHLRKKLDIRNFKEIPLGMPPSEIIPYDSTKRKTWKFEAINVHDFAFVADPTFRIGEAEWNGIKCIALACEPHAPRWQDAAQIAADVIKIYSEDFGMYAYPKIIVSDAQSGMEYPMLTMDGGLSPDYIYLFAHEIGHNWFYAMVGNNETYQAALDEGFTQFLTVWALEKLKDKYPLNSPDPSKFIETYRKHYPLRYSAVYNSYIENALKTEGVQLNTHSDMFHTQQSYGNEYRQTYNKTAVMLFNLQYVLGEEEFSRVMREYFSRWSFCHPYLTDFRISVNRSTGENFDWFFDQWLETSKTIDYGVKCVRRTKNPGEYKIIFHRYGNMQMPVDFTVYGKNDSVYHFIIPNSWYVKKTRATVLPRWTGWNHFNRKYTATVKINGGIKDVIIDPSGRLADINMINNSKKRNISSDFDYMFRNPPDWKNYEIYSRPDVWYNAYDGIKAGVHMEGGYMNYLHCFELYAWLNTRLLQQSKKFSHPLLHNSFSFMLSYRTPLKFITHRTNLFFNARSLDGVNLFALGTEQKSKSGKNVFRIFFKSLFLFGERSLDYLLYPAEWNYLKANETANYNNTINFQYKNLYQRKSCNGAFDFNIRTSAFGNDYNWAEFSFANIHTQKIWKFYLRTRVYAQFTTGESIPSESALYMAGANPETLIENKYTRAVGFVPWSWRGFGTGINHFHAGGGLNLRGYAGYLVAHDLSDGTVIPAYKGNSGASVNAELDVDRLVKFQPRCLKNWLKWNLYLFADAGIINVNKPGKRTEFAALRADAGLGTALTIKKWGVFDKFKPLTLRLDFPVFLNRPPAEQPGFVKFRYIVGINRAF